MAWLSPAIAQGAYSEDLVKAVFLYRFAGYVDWPAAASTGAPFTIAVLDADGVASELQRLLPNHPIKGRPAQLRRIRRVQELGDAEILYIGSGNASELRTLIRAIGARPVLLVSDAEGGLESGAMLNFLQVDRRVRFEVSLSAAERAGLKISSELLSVASRVQSGLLRLEAGCEPSAMPQGVATACIFRLARGISRRESVTPDKG
jgi:hypothetical protein